MTKITKKEMFTAIAEFAATGDLGFFNADDEFVSVSKDELKAFAEREIAALDKKAEKSREAAAKKRAEGDELTGAIKSCLTDEVQTVADLLVGLAAGGVETTASRVVARLSALVKNGEVEKSDVKIAGEDGKNLTRKAYKLV